MTPHTGNDNPYDNKGPAFDDGFGTGGTEGLLLPPWERRERFGFLNGLYLTIKDVLLAPRQFFHRMPSEVGLLEPMYFAVVMGVLSAFVGWMWSLAGSSLQILFADNIKEIVQGPMMAFGFFIASPFVTALGVVIKAALMHGMLMLVSGNRLGFEATFRVAAYGEAAGILALLPACGSGIGIIWSLVVTVIGLYSIHETDPWRAVVAVIVATSICASAISAGLAGVIMGMG